MADYTTAEPLFDFDTGDFVIVAGRPRLAVGRERVEGYIKKVLATQRDRYGIYHNSGYGIDVESIIGKNFNRDYIKSELKREISEALLKCDDILAVNSFSADIDGSKVTVRFSVTTQYGKYDTEEEL